MSRQYGDKLVKLLWICHRCATVAYTGLIVNRFVTVAYFGEFRTAACLANQRPARNRCVPRRMDTYLQTSRQPLHTVGIPEPLRVPANQRPARNRCVPRRMDAYLQTGRQPLRIVGISEPLRAPANQRLARNSCVRWTTGSRGESKKGWRTMRTVIKRVRE